MNIDYDFVRVGTVVEPRPRYLYLDVGNKTTPGIIDTHADPSAAEAAPCSASLIVTTPSLVTDWIQAGDPQTCIVVHENPDFDCIASSLLARKLIEARLGSSDQPAGWQRWAPMLAASAERVDQGKTRVPLPEGDARVAVTPYLALLVLDDAARARRLQSKKAWRWIVEQGQSVLEKAIDIAVASSSTDFDALDLRGALGDLHELEAFVDSRVAAFYRDAQRIGLTGDGAVAASPEGIIDLELPDRRDPSRTHPARVACILDPDSGAGFFKSIVRGAFHERIQATCIFTTVVPSDAAPAGYVWIRPIISVDPETPFDLRGLGRRLEIRETQRRAEAGVPRIGAPRPGYDTPDPWYDGRAHGHTIVDAPTWGTILRPPEVREILADWRTWHRDRLDDLVDEAIAALQSPFHERAARDTALHRFSSLMRAPFDPENDAQRRRTVRFARLIAASASARDGDALGSADVAVAPEIIVILLDARDPSVRVWAAAMAIHNRDAVVSHAKAIGRHDLATALSGAHGEASLDLQIDVRLAAGDDEALVPLLVRAAEVVGSRRAVIAAARKASAGTPRAATAQRALDLTRNEIAERSKDSFGEQWLTWRDIIREAESVDALPRESVDSAARELAAAERAMLYLAGLDERLARVIDLLRGCAERGEDEELDAAVSDLLSAAGSGGVGCAMAAGLVDRLGEVCDAAQWLAVPFEERTRRRERARGALVAILRGFAVVALPAAAAADRAAVGSAVECLARLGGEAAALELVADGRGEAVCWCDPRLLAQLVDARADQPAVVALLLDVAAGVRGHEITRGALRHICATASAEWLRDAAGLGRAVVLRERLPGSSPSYFARALAFRMLPLTEAHRRQWAETALAKIHPLLAGLVAEGAGDYHTDVSSLCELVHHELRYRLPHRRLVADFQSSISALDVLLRVRNLLGRSSEPAARFGRQIIEWVVRLPQSDSREQLAAFVRDRDRARDHSHCTEAVEWAAHALDNVIDCLQSAHHEAAMEPGRMRTALRELCDAVEHTPAGGFAKFLSAALRDAATFLEQKIECLDQLDEACGEDDDPFLAQALEVSTLAKLEDAFRAKAESRGDVVAAVAALATAAAGKAPAERSAALSKMRRDLAAGRMQGGAALTTIEQADAAYQRQLPLLHLAPCIVETMFGSVVDRLLAKYDLDRAQRRIEQCCAAPVGTGLRLWLSGAILLLPFAFLVVFILGDCVPLQTDAALQLLFGLSVAVTVLPFAGEAFRQLKMGRREASEWGERAKRKLFLPEFVVPVLVGVYSVGLTDELALKIAVRADDLRLALLFGGFGLAATWALAQLIRKQGGTVTAGKLLVTAGKIFSYAFFISMALTFILMPLIEHERSLSYDEAAKLHFLHLPMKVAASHSIIFFPRHLLLYSFLGLFVGIFLHGFLNARQSAD